MREHALLLIISLLRVSACGASLVLMLDIQFIREHTDIVKESQRKRGESVELVDEVLSSDTVRRESLKAFEEARAQQKEIGKKVASAPADEKVEMFVYAKQEDSYKEHEHLLAMEQEMLAKVEVPYRIIDTAAGDLGSSAARKFDCEAWVPTQDRYRELTSTSNCTEYQARRLNIRERMEDGGTRPVSTLNGTLATTRWLVAIMENHQQKDGSIEIPKAMRAYMGGKEVIEPTKWEA